MTNVTNLMLFSDQVPEPPEGTRWADWLRWMVVVINDDDNSIGFIAGCLSNIVRDGFLTDKQAKVCVKIQTRILHDYEADILDCQMNDPKPCPESHNTLSLLEPEGNA